MLILVGMVVGWYGGRPPTEVVASVTKNFFNFLFEISALKIKVSFGYREKYFNVKHDQEKILVIRA